MPTSQVEMLYDVILAHVDRFVQVLDCAREPMKVTLDEGPDVEEISRFALGVEGQGQLGLGV
jgi:hypothetical protein